MLELDRLLLAGIAAVWLALAAVWRELLKVRREETQCRKRLDELLELRRQDQALQADRHAANVRRLEALLSERRAREGERPPVDPLS